MFSMENMTFPPAVYHGDSDYNSDNYYYYYYENEDEDEDGVDESWTNTWKTLSIMSAVIFSLVCVLGVLGNGVVIWATRFRMKKNVTTVWYLSLAVADFLVTAFLPLQITSKALHSWPFGWFMCKMDGLVFYMNMYASIFTLVVISVDRCVGVVCPLWARCSGHRTVRKASWVCLGVWVLALALSVPEFTLRSFTHFDKICYSTYDNSDFQSGVMLIVGFLVGFVVPFSVIISCYSVIIYRLRNNRPLAVGQSGRSFKVIATVIAAFFLCWAPYHILRLIKVVYYKSDHLIPFSFTLHLALNFGHPITLTLALANSCLNPLLYVFSQGFKYVFRGSVVKVLEKAFAELPPQTDNTPRVPDIALPEIVPVGDERVAPVHPEPKTCLV